MARLDCHAVVFSRVLKFSEFAARAEQIDLQMVNAMRRQLVGGLDQSEIVGAFLRHTVFSEVIHHLATTPEHEQRVVREVLPDLEVGPFYVDMAN